MVNSNVHRACTSMTRKILAAIGLYCIASASAYAQDNPRLSWEDSYSVNGVCYCNSNFDHGIANTRVSTPRGQRTVRQVCNDIRSALGTGSRNGRIPYNDVQCGNGPANNAGDENRNRCPGRVDIGPRGCDDIGPRWNLNAVYRNTSTSPNPEPAPTQPTNVRGTSASTNRSDVRFATDGNRNTRWTTERPQRRGQWFQLDLGRQRTVSQVILDSARSRNDGPATYTVSTSTNGRNFTNVATGRGSATTRINFRDRRARYVRITQTGSKNRFWWSIHELTVR